MAFLAPIALPLAIASSVLGAAGSVMQGIAAGQAGRANQKAAEQAAAVRRQQGSSVGGDIASLEGGKWLLAIFVPPLVFIGLIVALIVWLVQRSRRRMSLIDSFADSPPALAGTITNR